MSAPAAPRVMGIVNVTPDSFSDGGRFLATDDAVDHGLQLLAEGADILDIGGESTRPGATRPLVADELARVVPVITELSEAGAVLSVDTMRSEVAEAALAAGALIVNDVSGGLADPRILDVAAAHDATYVAMHWRAHATQMQAHRHLAYPSGVVEEVYGELASRVDAARRAGVAKVVVDPGLGFSKTAEQNWELVRAIERFERLAPVLVGASRKSFLGTLLDGRPVGERESAHLAVVTHLAQQGVWAVRVHDVRATTDALKVVGALWTS